MAALRSKDWVVYAKEPLPNAQHVLTYRARYTHRVAISNHRLMALENGRVTFRYKDYKRRGELRSRTLEALEFLRRLMLHVPPRGFQRVRYYGFLAHRVRQHQLAPCRRLLGPATSVGHREPSVEVNPQEVPSDQPGAICPRCQQGQMQLVETWCRQPATWDLSARAPAFDTS